MATYNEYEDKEALIENPSIPDINKVKADDMNYIKYSLPHIGTSLDSSKRLNVLYSNNLFDGLLELGSYDNNGSRITNTNLYRNVNSIPVKPNTTYTFSINGVSQRYCLYYYNSSKTFLSLDTSLTTGTFTTPANCYYINFRCFAADYTSDFANLKVMLNEGSESLPYEPYITPSIVVDNDEIYSKPVVLYSSSTGSNGSITLNDDVSNYKYLEIYFDGGTSAATRLSMQKLDLSITNGASLFKWSVDSSGSVYAFIRDIKVSGTTLENFSSNPNYSSLTYTSGGWNRANTNNIYIFKVIGYK